MPKGYNAWDVYQQGLQQDTALNAELRARNYAALDEKRKFGQQQALMDQEYGQKQGLADQQFGYNWALQGQQYDAQAQQQDVRNLHDDELFDRHQAGQIAELHLQHLQQSKMAEFQAQKEMERLGATQDFSAQQQERSQDFAAQQQEAGFGQQTKMANLSANRAMDLQDASQDYGAQSQMFGAMNQAAAEHVRLKAQEAREEILRRHADETLDKTHQWEAEKLKTQAQAKIVQDNQKLVADGKAVFNDKKLNSLYEALDNLDEHRQDMSPENYNDAQQQLYGEIGHTMSRVRVLTEAEKSATQGAKMQQAWQQLGDPSDLPPMQYNKKEEAWQVVKGWKPAKEQPEPVNPEDFNQRMVDVDPNTGRMVAPNTEGAVRYFVNPKTGEPIPMKQPPAEKTPVHDPVEQLTLDQQLTHGEHYNTARKERRKEIAKEIEDDTPEVPNEKSWGIPGISSDKRPMNAAEKYKEIERRLEDEMPKDAWKPKTTATSPSAGTSQAGQVTGKVPGAPPAQPAAAGLPPGAKLLPNGDIQGPDGKIYRRKAQ